MSLFPTPSATIIEGDCRDRMREMQPDSVDAIVTDPPYGLSFMGKGWDHGVPGVEFWKEAMWVAKPGAHLLAFGGTRTYHRLACAIEDAGWEIRDCVMWVYGSGFPKSHDVSKAIDKAAGAEREVVGQKHVTNAAQGKGLGHGKLIGGKVQAGFIDITAPATDAARQWSGWGTALKPAWEPIIVARKPLIGTVAENVLRYGTGGINVDGCRIATTDTYSYPNGAGGNSFSVGADPDGTRTKPVESNPAGRWPANVIHDGSDEVVGLFPVTGPSSGRPRRNTAAAHNTTNSMGKSAADWMTLGHDDAGGPAARFFYCAKASKADRGDGNTHPTVKPTAMMRYLCRLVTPPGGTVLDPFCGSGSTGKAAVLEGFNFVGIEREPEYVEIAKARIAAVQ